MGWGVGSGGSGRSSTSDSASRPTAWSPEPEASVPVESAAAVDDSLESSRSRAKIALPRSSSSPVDGEGSVTPPSFPPHGSRSSTPGWRRAPPAAQGTTRPLFHVKPERVFGSRPSLVPRETPRLQRPSRGAPTTGKARSHQDRDARRTTTTSRSLVQIRWSNAPPRFSGPPRGQSSSPPSRWRFGVVGHVHHRSNRATGRGGAPPRSWRWAIPKLVPLVEGGRFASRERPEGSAPAPRHPIHRGMSLVPRPQDSRMSKPIRRVHRTTGRSLGISALPFSTFRSPRLRFSRSSRGRDHHQTSSGKPSHERARPAIRWSRSPPSAPRPSSLGHGPRSPDGIGRPPRAARCPPHPPRRSATRWR